MKIIRLATSKKGYGGNIYELMVDEALKKKFSFELELNSFQLKGFWRLLEAPKFFWNLWRFANKKGSFLIRTFQSAFFPFRGKGVTIVYHVDSTGSPLLPRLFQDFLEWWFLSFIPKNEPIVVIADYWRNFLKERGFQNLHLIYCGYELEKYSPTELEVQQFLEKHDLAGKQIVYIGNPQVKKGATLAFEALKDTEFTLVTSGVADTHIPCRHLDLSFRDYVCLLKASSVVVAMSLFKEGWNRVAHEAMLVGTPVVGSGAGGMEELLLGGGQIICDNPRKIKEAVNEALSKAPEMIEKGKNYAIQFSKERFEKEWQDLVEQLARLESP